MFVPKFRLFPLNYWFVNLIHLDKHGAKNFRDVSALGWLEELKLAGILILSFVATEIF